MLGARLCRRCGRIAISTSSRLSNHAAAEASPTCEESFVDGVHRLRSGCQRHRCGVWVWQRAGVVRGEFPLHRGPWGLYSKAACDLLKLFPAHVRVPASSCSSSGLLCRFQTSPSPVQLVEFERSATSWHAVMNQDQTSQAYVSEVSQLYV